MAGAIAAGRNLYNAVKHAQTGAKRSARGRTRARGRAPVTSRTKISLHQRGKQCGQAGSFSSFFYERRIVPKRLYNIYKAIAVQLYQTNVSGYCPVTSAGKHNNAIVASAFCGNNVFVAQAIQSDLPSMNHGISNMNGGYITRKFLLESISGEVMLQNQTNMNTRVILYDI